MLIQADAFHLPYLDEIFHACITSPPYWGMRKYSGEQGDEPLGLEEDDQIYIEKLVVAFREVNRVLRPDGVLWVNLGDCYTGGGRGGQSAKKRSSNWQPEYRRVNSKNLPQGSLMLLPHRVALAMQEDGWILRNDNVWWKRNPMPDPVAGWRWERHRLKDENGDWINCQGCEKCLHDNPLHPDLYVPKFGSWRHTRGHEYVFQFVKGMGYYCNQEVVRESMTRKPGLTDPGNRIEPRKEVIEHLQERGSGGHFDGHKWNMNSAGRNPRSVLDVPTTSYSGSHYAVFPPKLIAPLIEASVPRRSCPECGRPWSPVVDRGEPVFGKSSWGLKGRRHFKMDVGDMVETGLEEGSTLKHDVPRQVVDYRPTCDCGREDHVPGIVLDPFGGTGTTGMVAKQLMRRWVVMDISRPYLDEQAKIRTKTGAPSKGVEGLPMFDGIEEGY